MNHGFDQELNNNIAGKDIILDITYLRMVFIETPRSCGDGRKDGSISENGKILCKGAEPVKL